MSAANFVKSLAFTLAQEGGFVDDPRDPGGATNFGITLATFRTFEHGGTVEQLRAITTDEVRRIYLREFWSPLGCDNLPSGIDLSIFDAAVNMGPARVIGYLQVIAGVRRDGRDGAITEAAVAKMPATDVITKLGKLYIAHYESLPTFDRFGRGWLARNERRTKAALESIEVTPVNQS